MAALSGLSPRTAVTSATSCRTSDLFGDFSAILGITRYLIPVLHAVQPLEGIPPFVQDAPVQIRRQLPFAICRLSVTPQIVCAVIFRQQDPGFPNLSRGDEVVNLRSERRDDLVYQPPGIAAPRR